MRAIPMIACWWVCIQAAGAAQGQTPLDTAEIFVEDVTYSGNGCPSGSARISMSQEHMLFSLAYDELMAMKGPDIDRTRRRKSCTLNMLVHAPQGYSFAITELGTEGSVDLDPGTSVDQSIALWFSGDPFDMRVIFRSDFYGPVHENYTDRRVFGVESIRWSPCGGTVPVNIQVSLKAVATDPARAAISVDRLSHFVMHWQRCDTPPVTDVTQPEPPAPPTPASIELPPAP